jgi:ATP-dependent Zn protease
VSGDVTRTEKRRATAYHEAGHAVAGWFHDLAVREVTIAPEPGWDWRGGSNGHVV